MSVLDFSKCLQYSFPFSLTLEQSSSEPPVWKAYLVLAYTIQGQTKIPYNNYTAQKIKALSSEELEQNLFDNETPYTLKNCFTELKDIFESETHQHTTILPSCRKCKVVGTILFIFKNFLQEFPEQFPDKSCYELALATATESLHDHKIQLSPERPKSAPPCSSSSVTFTPIHPPIFEDPEEEQLSEPSVRRSLVLADPQEEEFHPKRARVNSAPSTPFYRSPEHCTPAPSPTHFESETP